MKIETTHFGDITIAPENILSFPRGLPGFEDQRRFVLLQRPQEAPISWLQAVEDSNLALAVVEPGHFVPGYVPAVPRGDLATLHLKSLDGALVLTVLVLNTDPRQITANLQAPVVINETAHLGAQLVLGEEWPRRYYLFAEEKLVAGGEKG